MRHNSPDVLRERIAESEGGLYLGILLYVYNNIE